jgi:hypothetical protein
MVAEAGTRDPMDETFREYERVVDSRYNEISAGAQQFSTKRLSRESFAECAVRDFKNCKNTLKPRTVRKLTRALHDLQKRTYAKCRGLTTRLTRSVMSDGNVMEITE